MKRRAAQKICISSEAGLAVRAVPVIVAPHASWDRGGSAGGNGRWGGAGGEYGKPWHMKLRTPVHAASFHVAVTASRECSSQFMQRQSSSPYCMPVGSPGLQLVKIAPVIRGSSTCQRGSSSMAITATVSSTP